MRTQRPALLLCALVAACRTHVMPSPGPASRPATGSYGLVARVERVGTFVGRVSLDSNFVVFRSNSSSASGCTAPLDIDASGRVRASCPGVELTLSRTADGLAKTGRIAFAVATTSRIPASALDCRESFGLAKPLQYVTCAKSAQGESRTKLVVGRVELTRVE